MRSLLLLALLAVLVAQSLAAGPVNSISCSCKSSTDDDHAELTLNVSIMVPPMVGNRYWVAYYEPSAQCGDQIERTVLDAFPRASSVRSYFPLRSKTVSYECALFQAPELVVPGDQFSCNLDVKTLVTCPPNKDVQNHATKTSILIGAGVAAPLGIVGVCLITWVIYRNAKNRRFVEEYRVDDKNIEVALDSSDSEDQYEPLANQKESQVALESDSD